MRLGEHDARQRGKTHGGAVEPQRKEMIVQSWSQSQAGGVLGCAACRTGAMVLCCRLMQARHAGPSLAGSDDEVVLGAALCGQGPVEGKYWVHGCQW